MVDKVNEDDVALAIRRGALGRCPKCGLGNLFLGFLTVRQNCPVCREGFAEYRAADGPAFLTITVVGILMIPTIGAFFLLFRPDPLAMAVTLSAVLILLSLFMLRVSKGAIVGYLWATGAKDPGA